MGEQLRTRPEEMATTSTAIATVPQIPETEPRVAVITLRPTRTETRKKVVWTEDTVDNEHMNKKKSKCCCIYEKPKKFGESDSEDSDDECEHCFGHVEKKREKKHHHQHSGECTQHGGGSGTLTIKDDDTPPHEPTATITLQPTETAPTTTVPPQPTEADPTPAPAPPDEKQDQ